MDRVSFMFVIKHGSIDFVSMVVLLLCSTLVSPACCYDSLDPNGNITIKWDVLQKPVEYGNQNVRVSIANYQLFRHIGFPGWKLSWEWRNDEVIWAMTGAETTEQGDCSRFIGASLPHSCAKIPVVIDLLPNAPFNKQVNNCCRGGILTSMMQDPAGYLSAFEMNVGSASSHLNIFVPANFTLGFPGYTCGDPIRVPPTKFPEDHGRRSTQAFETWDVTCSYSQFRASSTPTCCVSLSAFYSTKIVDCPKCSCACQGQAGNCVKSGESPPAIQLGHNEQPKPLLDCTSHMCPIKVHWHVKQSYTEYWRVKITVTNFNHAANYSGWNLVALHPNLDQITQVYSFNYKPIGMYGDINDTGIFYGIKNYNDILLQSGQNGNVQTELLMHKDGGKKFSFNGGWAFPRKISFNGEDCLMPLPDEYPRLPNKAVRTTFLIFYVVLLHVFVLNIM
ncbi:hypothetical protein ABFX02_02G070900 [Erythranthe guttata]